MRRIGIALSALVSILIASGCSDEPTNPSTGTLKLNFTGLGDLGSNAVYEGWIIVAGAPKSTGTFTVSSSGVPSKTEFTVSRSDLSVATAFILTVEPNDGNIAPSDAHLLAGDFTGNSASLTVSHSSALGNSFASAAGKYILATPTDGMNTNEKSGIWFLEMGSSGPMAALQLPALPAGWKYEGWAVINGTPLTTGKFTSVSGADEAAPFSGSQPGPPFPGEDYLRNAPSGLTFPTDLSGGTTVITIEPHPDNASAPFALKPLTGMIPAAATPGTPYMLTNGMSTFPTGTATR